MHLEHRELRWAALTAAGIVLLMSLPYLFGWWLRPADYMGHVYNADDANVHLSWMRQAAEGRWLFTDRFTSEAQQPQFTHLLFLLLGKIGGLFGGSYRALLVIYHLTRVVAGWGVLVVVYLLAAFIYPERETRRTALLAVGLSSGLGWWLWKLLGVGDRSVDFGVPIATPEGGVYLPLLMPEAITFLSLYTFPLFAVSLLLLVGAYLLFLRALDAARVKVAVAAGVLALILGQIHSYDILPFYVALALYVVLLGILGRRWPLREAGVAAVVVAVSLPAPLYQYLVFRSNPVFQQKALTPTLSPPLAQYLLTYGVVLLAAIVGAACLRRKQHRHGWLLVVWAVATLAMAYAPLSFQRKMVEGVHIPIAILGAAGWVALGRRLRVPHVAWTLLFLLLTFPSNAGMMADSLRRLVNNNTPGVAAQLPPYYLEADERAALDLLARVGRPGDVVLSSLPIGSYLPPYCGVTAYAGHWAETIDLGKKYEQVATFLRGAVADEWRISLLREQRIRYLYYGPLERAMGSQRGSAPFDPAQASYLKPLYESDAASLYEVVLP